uniref:Cilia and flagella associated protein 46 n=1 Tax=Scleropages formosus TaxID=113540 RepID=A0A8C9R4N7_SCLFO
MSKECLNMYFKGKPPANQFLIRAYLCGGQLTSLQSSGRGDIEKVVMFFLKAIEISKEQPRYHFLVFNASVLYFQAIGPFLRPGTKQHLVSSLMQVVKALEDIREEDLKWRAQLMLHLVECLVDAGRKKEAASFAKLTSDFAQVNTPDLYPRIFSLQDAECLVKIECLKCELDLHKRGSKLQGYAKGDVEAQLKMVKRLDHSLQSAVRGGGRSLIQAVCATLWNACLPLLQLNLRKSIKGQLVRMAQALEESRSLLLEMRFQVHNEISEMEVEEDHLECAIEHLEKAMRLDEEGMHRERLSASLRQLRARRSLYEMPDRAEDRAALLIEQAKRGSPKNDVKKIRSLLINAGKALAPDAFQVLLEADVEAKGIFKSSYCGGITNICCLYLHVLVSSLSMTTVIAGWTITRFLCHQAAIQKLRSEGVNFNQEPSPPEDRRKDVPPEEDPQWTIYREWALEMSAQATISFLRAAELGAEIREQWIISNAAVYLWNYNKHILAAGGQCQLLAPFQKLIDIMKLVGHTSEMVLQVLLCNTVAQILIPSPSPPANRVTQEKEENKKPPPPERGKKGAGKRVESVQSISMDPATVQEGKKVLELCDYAFHLTSSTDGGKAVTLAARKQVIGTWVQIKQVLQQQLGPNPDVDEEVNPRHDTVMAMTRVLVAIEVLLSKSNSGVMESSLPTLSELVTMASECRWTDPTVELHTWTHLLHFAHVAQDHDLIMSCSQKALQCEDAALKRVKMSTCAL